jgi:hypothetical protein
VEGGTPTLFLENVENEELTGKRVKKMKKDCAGPIENTACAVLLRSVSARSGGRISAMARKEVEFFRKNVRNTSDLQWAGAGVEASAGHRAWTKRRSLRGANRMSQ